MGGGRTILYDAASASASSASFIALLDASAPSAVASTTLALASTALASAAFAASTTFALSVASTP